MMVTTCDVANGVGHSRSDPVGQLAVTCYVPHRATRIVLEVLQDTQIFCNMVKRTGRLCGNGYGL
jgi:hypothetical protein